MSPDMETDTAARRKKKPDQKPLAPVFAGGVGLGVFQAGAYAELDRAGRQPDGVAGSSVGAINAAIIAGSAERSASRICST